MDDLNQIAQSVREGDQEQTVRLVREALANAFPPEAILKKGLISGLQKLGELFKGGEVFLPEILISVRAMNRGLEVVKPQLTAANMPAKGTVVIGTIQGDLHDIGKNLVRMMLEGNGYRVIDLGTDVSPGVFAQAAQEHKADIVAVSSLLTTTMTRVKDVVVALQEADRKRVKVMIGGAPVTRAFAEEIGAEGFAEDCVTAVDEANRLLPGKGTGKGGI